MVIDNPDFDIHLAESISSEVSGIAKLPAVAKNLTEKWTYPSGIPDSLNFEIIKDDQVIGQAAYKSFRWFNRKAELSLFLHPDFQNKGVGTGILKSMINHAFSNLNLHRLEAEVNVYNKKAIKVMEKLGFVREGILREARYLNGKYYDILRYGLLKSEYEISINI